MNHPSTQSADQTLWQAYRFVAGEMSEAESLAFEVRLEAEPQLCEVVVEATQLVLAVKAERPVADSFPNAESTPLVTVLPVRPPVVSRGRRVAAVTATIVSAALLLLLATFDWPHLQVTDPSGEVRLASASESAAGWLPQQSEFAEAERLLALWSSEEQFADDQFSAEFDTDEYLTETADSSAEVSADDVLDVPDWVLAAVSLEDRAAVESDPGQLPVPPVGPVDSELF